MFRDKENPNDRPNHTQPVPPGRGRRGLAPDQLEAIRYFREWAGGEIPVMGWVEGALAEADDLRGFTQIMMDLVQCPERVIELLECCVGTEIASA